MVIYGAKGITVRVQARDLLAQAVREVWGLPGLPEIARQEGGKPFFPAHKELHFNLSHSGGLALCALDCAPVGVDIQIVKEWRASLPRRVCSAQEMAWLESQTRRWYAFTELWALKESRAKEDGKGLTGLIRGIQIPLPAEEPIQLDGLWFRSYTGPDWAAAVCGRGQPPKEITWRTL